MEAFVKGAWLAAAVLLCAWPRAIEAQGSIEGSVVDAATGTGIAGARVGIHTGQDDPIFTTADDQGNFQFTGLKFASYQVEARNPGFLNVRDPVRGPAAANLGSRHPAATVRLEMRRSGAILGKVADTMGIPVEGVRVMALGRHPAGDLRAARFEDGGYQYATVQETFTDDLGEYRLGPLAAGSYYLYIEPGSHYQVARVPPTDPADRPTFYPQALKISDAKPLELAEGKELRQDLQIVRRSGVKMGIHVPGAIAGVAAGLRISVMVRPELGPMPSTSSDSLGDDRFQATGLLPGRYIVEAAQYASSDLTNQAAVAAARKAVDVGTEDIDGIDLTLAPTPDIAGAVVFDAGCTAVPVWIQLQGARLLDLHVAIEGHFVLPHLFPGNYRMYVRPETASYSSATSAKLDGAEVLTDGFEATAATKGPITITMSCSGR